MKRPKYHFLTIVSTSRGKILTPVPGQTFGQTPVPSGILVKDVKGSTIITRTKKKGDAGEIYFTTTLKSSTHYLTATDIYQLTEDNVLFSDARDAYERLGNN